MIAGATRPWVCRARDSACPNSAAGLPDSERAGSGIYAQQTHSAAFGRNQTEHLVSEPAYDASAHDFTTGWRYDLHDGSIFARNCTKCSCDARLK